MIRKSNIIGLSVPLLLCGLSGCYYPVYTAYPAPAYPYGYAPAPQTAYVAPAGQAPVQDCREYTKEVIISGQKQQAVGRACRQPDGSWKDISSGEVFKAPPPPPPVPAAPPQSQPYYYNYPYNGYYNVPQR